MSGPLDLPRQTANAWPPTDALLAPYLEPDAAVDQLVGIRPYRRGSVRVEVKTLDRKTIVHHYGHGGAGITLAPATAHDAAGLVDASAMPLGTEVAVLGAGVVGLTTADLLLDRGYRVTIYADKLTPDTTSDLAGGQFAPATVAIDDRAKLDRWMRTAADYYLARVGKGCGVERVVNFTAGSAGSALRRVPATDFRAAQLDRLPIQGINASGHAFETLLITPPTYLPWLTVRLRRRGVSIRVRRFASLNDIARLPEPVVVNCLGLGSRTIFDDEALLPIRGRLVKLRPQPLGYLLSQPRGYLFGRSDGVILGGTYDRGATDTTPDPGVTTAILNRHRRFFGQPPLSTEKSAKYA